MFSERNHVNEESRHLQTLARELTDAYVEHADPCAVLLTGSAATGEADRFSDLDLIVYHDALPPESAFAAARESVGGVTGAAVLAQPTETEYPEVYTWRGVQCQVAHTTVSSWERDLRSVLEDLVPESPLQKAISGLFEGIALHGGDLIAKWQRETVYPDALARAMVEHHWRFFPIWHLQEGCRPATLRSGAGRRWSTPGSPSWACSPASIGSGSRASSSSGSGSSSRRWKWPPPNSPTG